MPELPEVETTRRGIAPHIVGGRVTQVVVRERRMRVVIPADLAEQVEGGTVRAVERRGKYLLLRFEQGTLLLHLGMSGSLRLVAPALVPAAHDHVDLVFDERICLRLRDPRRFGLVLWTGEDPSLHPLLRKLGPEPLTRAFSAAYLHARTRARTQAIKPLLMDAHQVVGVGNIYANEALFLAGIAPQRAAGRLNLEQCRRLVTAVKIILRAAIRQGGTTLRDFVDSDGQPGYFSQRLKVYGRGGLPCGACGALLRETRQGQRATVHCPRCQK